MIYDDSLRYRNLKWRRTCKPFVKMYSRFDGPSSTITVAIRGDVRKIQLQIKVIKEPV